MSADRPEKAEATAAVPALVRDYRRLLRLFPFAYRRAHGAEMLGHLLDAAAPGQSRPARGDVVDLLRAAAREWALAPLGSTAPERRAGTGLLCVALPALLAVPAVRAGGHAASLVPQDGAPPLLSTVPMVVAWAIWALGVVALLTGAGRAGRTLVAAAAVVAALTVGALLAVGQAHAAFLETGWAVGLAAHALVVVEHARCRASEHDRRLAVITAAGMALAVVAYVLATVSDAAHLGLPWWSSVASTTWSTEALVAPLMVLGLAATLWARTRQAVPLMAGVLTGIVLGRSQFFWSGSVDPSTVDLGNVLGLLALSLGAACSARWVVNRIGELAEVRARLQLDAEQAVGPGTGVVGGP
ncbi:hypothetical protein [Isoptericola sp. NPDC058082]|uniref:hypothetical protein n=1 Tax=Isoptericola sp. NPDC058082 TaxID=3346331 RepID=UPI0036EDF0AB